MERFMKIRMITIKDMKQMIDRIRDECSGKVAEEQDQCKKKQGHQKRVFERKMKSEALKWEAKKQEWEVERQQLTDIIHFNEDQYKQGIQQRDLQI